MDDIFGSTDSSDVRDAAPPPLVAIEQRKNTLVFTPLLKPAKFIDDPPAPAEASFASKTLLLDDTSEDQTLRSALSSSIEKAVSGSGAVVASKVILLSASFTQGRSIQGLAVMIFP